MEGEKSEEAKPLLKFKGIPFSYCAEKSAFLLDERIMFYILCTHFPSLWEETLKLHPELEAHVAESEYHINIEEKQQLDAEWKMPPQSETNVTEEAEEKSVESKVIPKPGMISRISKGIKKIIAKLTPKKLHKRFHLADEEED